MENNNIVKYEVNQLQKVKNVIEITNKLLNIDFRKIVLRYYFDLYPSEELKQWTDAVQTLIEEDGGLSLKQVQDKVAELWGDRSQDDLVEDAYNEATKNLKITGKETEEKRSSFRKEGEKTEKVANELSTQFTERVKNFIGKLFDLRGEVKTLKDSDALDKAAGNFGGGVDDMYNGKGEMLAFIDPNTGNIFLNGEKLNSNTLMHAAGHLWLDWAEKNLKPLFEEGLRKIRKEGLYLSKVTSIVFYKNEADKLASKQSKEESDGYQKAYNRYMEKEAFAHAIGDSGAHFFMETKRDSFNEWAEKLWETLSKYFGFKNKTAEEIGSMTLEELTKHIAADILDPDSIFENKS